MKVVVNENEPVIDLKKEDFGERFEGIPRELLRILPMFLDREPAKEIVLVADRKYELFSVKLEAAVIESLRDLEKEDFPARAEFEATESTNVLKKEDSRAWLTTELNVPASDLKTEVCSLSVVAEPIEIVRNSFLPVNRRLPRVSESVKDLT
jgi:hypothetical protein